MPLQKGTSIGPYEILLRLGSGGMGEVYRARDPRLGREVAVKVLNEEAARDRDRRRRFIAEAKAASALNHPNILTVHEIGETEAGPYIVTELVEGDTVRDLLREGPLPLPRAVEIAVQAAEGITKAHEAGILHRDLKPENLMITRDGFAKKICRRVGASALFAGRLGRVGETFVLDASLLPLLGEAGRQQAQWRLQELTRSKAA